MTLANAPDFLTPVEACELLRIGRTTMYAYLANQTISCRRIGRKILIPKSSIMDMMGEAKRYDHPAHHDNCTYAGCCGK